MSILAPQTPSVPLSPACPDHEWELRESWELGYRYALELVAEAVDDLAHLWVPQASYEERVARRVAEMAKFDVAAFLGRSRARDRAHDRAALTAGSSHLPISDWGAVYAAGPAVWARVLGDSRRSPDSALAWLRANHPGEAAAWEATHPTRRGRKGRS